MAFVFVVGFRLDCHTVRRPLPHLLMVVRQQVIIERRARAAETGKSPEHLRQPGPAHCCVQVLLADGAVHCSSLHRRGKERDQIDPWAALAAVKLRVHLVPQGDVAGLGEQLA